jgi:hypothetical protein
LGSDERLSHADAHRDRRNKTNRFTPTIYSSTYAEYLARNVVACCQLRCKSSWRARDLEFESLTDPLAATVGNSVHGQQIAAPVVSTKGQEIKRSNPRDGRGSRP